MFKNHSIKIKFVKDAQTPNEESTPIPTVTPEEISRTAKDLTKYIAIAGGLVIGATYVLKTLNEVAVIATENAMKKNND